MKVGIPVWRRRVLLQQGQSRRYVLALDHDPRKQHRKTGVLRIERESLPQNTGRIVNALGLEQERDQGLARPFVSGIDLQRAAEAVHAFGDAALIDEVDGAAKLVFRAIASRGGRTPVDLAGSDIPGASRLDGRD